MNGVFTQNQDQRPLRISYFTATCHEQGTYFRWHNWAIALTQLGHSVTVWACDQDPASRVRDEMRDGVLYRIVPTSRLTGLFTSAAHPLSAARRGFQPYERCDIAHLFQPFLNGALPWWMRARRLARRCFYDWDDLWEGGLLEANASDHHFRVRWHRESTTRLERWLPSQADAVTTCSQFLRERAVERGARSATVIHNGFWPFEPTEKKEARAKMGLLQDAIYVGFMGRTTAELDWCFDALARVMTQHPRLRMALCGASPEALINLSPTIRERIDFLGHLSARQTRDFAAALDIGLLPLKDNAFNRSRFPIKFAEYLAAGVPVLASDLGECAMLSKGRPWVLSAGQTRESWNESFANAVNSASTGTLPTVDRAALLSLLSWQAIGDQLLDSYVNGFARRAGDSLSQVDMLRSSSPVENLKR